jgi:phenylalanyl-tRNA synthetase beta chain
VRIPVSWLREHVELPADPGRIEHALTQSGVEVEQVIDLRSTVEGPLVVGRVLSVEELRQFKKPVRFCAVDVGEPEPRGIICGAPNVVEGALVVVALPGAVLPGGFAIAARRTYDHISDGMICSGRELGVSDDHTGILVLPPGSAAPGEQARPAVGLDDIVLDLEITPDRGYCQSVRGLARELSHALGTPFTDPGAPHPDADPGAPAGAGVPYPVTVRDPVGCDRFAARLVTGVDPGAATPAWMSRRLAVAGIRSISLAVDITNYLMLEIGQPMHAFDPNRLAGPLVVRRALPGERLTTLDGITRALDPADMVICDAGQPNPLAPDGDGLPVSLAAVMGGENSEMLPDSVDVLLEAAHWDAAMVSGTARRHRLWSEAAKRWERGVDPRLPLVALERAAALLREYGGGTVDPRVLDIDAVAPPRPVRLPVGLASRVAGVAYPPARVVALLSEIGARVEEAGEVLTVTPPSWRPDLLEPADLVEEVVRLDGYEHVPSLLPGAPQGSGLTPGQRRRRSVGRALAEAGYLEVLSYPFVSPQVADALGLPADDPDRDALRLANPLSDEEPLLRTALLPTLLATLRRNLGRGQRDLGLYEMGLVFHPAPAPPRPVAPMGVAGRPGDEELAAHEKLVPAQPWHVAAVLVGEAEPAGWWGPARPACWADAVEAGRIAVAAAGAVPQVRAGARAPWHPGRCAEIVVAGRVAGYAGELHPAVCDALELPRRTAAMELELDAVPLPGVVAGPRFSTFPPVLIDVAVVVAAATPQAQVRHALAEGAGPLLEAVRLFDVYTSGALGEGRKSLAYKLIFRAPDRTLTVEEAVAARDAALAVAGSRVGATLRGA